MKSKIIIIIGLLILLAIPCSAYALETISIPSPEEAQLELISVSGIPDDLVVRLVLKDNIIAEIHGNTIIHSAEINAEEKLLVKIRFVGKGNLSSAQFNFIEKIPQPTTAYKSKSENKEILDENDGCAEDPKEENMEDENMVGENTEEEKPDEDDDEDDEDDIEDNDVNDDVNNDDNNNDGSSDDDNSNEGNSNEGNSNEGNSNEGNSNEGNSNEDSSNEGSSNDEESKNINSSVGNEEVKGG